jgi:type I restriction enzyme S subunit
MTPEGWERATIDGITASCDYGLSCALSNESRGVPVLRMGNLQQGRLRLTGLKYVAVEQVDEQHLLRPGDLLLNRTNSLDLVGKVGLFRSEERFTFASYLFRIRADALRADPEWLTQLLGSFTYQARLREIATPGVSQANINRERLRALPVLVPPLGEQKKIAAILSSVDEAIEATQAVIDQLQVVKKAMMAELLTRGLPGRHTRFKQTEIGEVPQEWDVVRIGEVCDRMFVGIAQAATHAYVATGGVPLIRTTNVRANLLVKDDVLRITDTFAR